MRSTFFLIFLSVCATVSQARELSLKDALDLAERHSFRIKRAKAERAAYEENLKAAIAERYPTLSASLLASYKDQVPTLEIDLPVGQSVTRDFGFKETYQSDLKISLPLFTGGKIGGNIDLARAIAARYNALERVTLDEALFLSRVEYLSLCHADRMLDVARAALRRATIIDSDIQSLYAAGAADSVDILEARHALNEAEFRVKDAASVRRRREIGLITLLGLDPLDAIVITDTLSEPDRQLPVRPSVSASKPELKAASATVTVSKSFVKLNRSAYFPTLSVFGGYSYGKPNIDPFHDSFNDYFAVGATVDWSFNLGRKNRAKLSMSKHQLQAAQNEYDRIRERLDREAQMILERLKLTLEKHQTALENCRIASDNYRLSGEKHRQGVLSANRLLETEAAFSAAESMLATAQVEYFIVQSEYYYTVGSGKLKEGL